MIENNKQVQKQVEQDVVTQQYFNKTLAEYNGKFSAVDGTPLTVDEATSRVKNGATLLVSADGKPVAKAWLRAAASDTVVMVADDFTHVQPQWGSAPMPNTPSPRLTMLGTNENGKVMAPCTSAPINPNGVYYDDVMWEGRAQFRGRVRNFDGAYYNQAPADAKVVLKPLADVKFDAYDLNGKLIPQSEVLKRLAVGGMVIVAGDSRMPDDTYLKGFREDVIVLVGPELVIPVAPVDQTKKKEQKDKEQPANDKVQPVAPPVPILPAGPAIQIQPAVIRPVAIKGGAVRPVAPAPAEKPAKEEVKKDEVKREEAKPEKK
jgi:hypothetical protein